MMRFAPVFIILRLVIVIKLSKTISSGIELERIWDTLMATLQPFNLQAFNP